VTAEAVRYRRSPAALWRRVGGTILVTTGADPDVHELLGGAAAAWVELIQPRTVPELVDGLAEVHEAQPDSIEEQVSNVLETLRDLGVVDEADRADA
jgi:hypothetical protein